MVWQGSVKCLLVYSGSIILQLWYTRFSNWKTKHFKLKRILNLTKTLKWSKVDKHVFTKAVSKHRNFQLSELFMVVRRKKYYQGKINLKTMNCTEYIISNSNIVKFLNIKQGINLPSAYCTNILIYRVFVRKWQFRYRH